MKKNLRYKIINALANFFAHIIPIKTKPKHPSDIEYKHTAQKIGAHQNQKVKSNFRHKWLKLSKDS